MDKVDEVIQQWNRERPDLDVGPMELIGRFKRIAQHLTREMDKTIAASGLNLASFDVLATLRRAGPPYQLSPNDLLATMMITSGTMTNRIDKLVCSGLVERIHNPDDGRSVFISLTNKGFTTIDAAVSKHVETQAKLVSGISLRDKTKLNEILRKFLSGFE